MIPQGPSTVVPPDSSATQLLRLGHPFVEFPRYSILQVQNEREEDGTRVPFSEWLTKRLQIGKPFVLGDFQHLAEWDAKSFDIERLIELSTTKSEFLLLSRGLPSIPHAAAH